MKIKASTTLLFFFLILSTSQAQQVAPFKDGDCVTFVGNSITDGGHYHSYIWLYYMTRFPNANIRFYNCGIGGETTADIYKRLDSDVFNKKPTVLTLTFGMNDTGYGGYNGKNAEAYASKQIAESYKGFKDIEKRLKEELPDTRIIMVGSSPYDQTSKFNNNILKKKNDAICRIIDFQKEAAQLNHWEFIDFNAPMVAINTQEQKKDSTFTLCGRDRIHPDNDGHMVMAYEFLRSQGFSGKEVASITLDAQNQKLTHHNNCYISSLEFMPGKVRFNYLADALPYPLDTLARGANFFTRSQSLITKLRPSFMEEMSREVLTIKGLQGNYELKIDDEVIGVFPAEKLSSGLNLAECTNTPQYQQALAIMTLNEERWEIERRLRDYNWLQYSYFDKHNLRFADNEEAVKIFKQGKDFFVVTKGDLYGRSIHKSIRDVWEKEQDILINKIYSINKPVTHKIELTVLQ